MLNRFWKYISNLGLSESYSLVETWRIKNLNRFLFLTFVIAILNTISDYSKELYFYSLFDLFVSISFFMFLLLNRVGLYKISKHSFLLFLNIIIFIFASLGGSDTGLYLFFFPVIIIDFFFIGATEKKTLFFYICFPIALLILTVVTDFTLFKFEELNPDEIKYLYWESLFNLVIFTSFSLYNIIYINESVEKSLLEEKANFDAMLNNNLLNIILLDTEMNVKAFNEMAQMELIRLYNKEIQIGDSILNLLPNVKRKDFKKYLNDSLNGKNIQVQTILRTENSSKWFEIELSPAYDGNILDGVIFSSMEITERKKYENYIRRKRKKAETANKEKSHFLSTISHEIRTPMNAIIGMVGILLENKPIDKQVTDLTILKDSAESLLAIINDILDFNRIDSGEIEIEESEFMLKQLVDTVGNYLSPLIQEKSIQLNINYDEKIPQVLLGDSVRLSQIITNILSNSIKFTEKGQIILSVDLEEQDDKYSIVCFSISDTGSGISQDKINYIFEKFTLGNEENFERLTGTGLGLAITSRLLKLMDSTVFLESELNKGSKFYFSIRFRLCENIISKRKEIPNKVFDIYKSELLKGIRLLLVDDYLINQIVASEFLGKWKIRIDIADNGMNAIEKFNTEEYDIILMDLQMPDMDGFETTKNILESEKWKNRNIPIIALTASAISEIQEQVRGSGMIDCISKPFDPEDLFNKLVKYTRNKE